MPSFQNVRWRFGSEQQPWDTIGVDGEVYNEGVRTFLGRITVIERGPGSREETLFNREIAVNPQDTTSFDYFFRWRVVNIPGQVTVILRLQSSDLAITYDQSQNSYTIRAPSPPPPSPPQLVIAELTIAPPGDRRPGDTVSATITVRNQGGQSGSAWLQFWERQGGVDYGIGTPELIALAPGEVRSFTRSWLVSNVPGRITVRAELVVAGSVVSSREAFYNVVQPSPPAQLVINSLTLTTPGTRNPGDPVTAVVSVANNGGQPGSADLVFRERWPNGQEVNIGTPSPITLQPGQSQSYQRTWGTPGVTGNITVRAELRVGGAVISFREASYQVVQPPPSQPPPSQPPPSGGSPLLPIGLGAGIALGLYLLKRRRKR